MAQTVKNVEITQAQARVLTDKIRSAADKLWSLLLEAHDGKAWKAMGYATWEAYIGAEFDMSLRQSYNLLDQGRITRAIEDAAGVQHVAQITHRDAQAIKPAIKEVSAEIKAKVEAGADPVQTTYEVIEAKRKDRKVEPAAPSVSKQQEPAPAAANEESDDERLGVDELLTDLQRENEELRALVAAAEAEDQTAEAVKWRKAYENSKRSQSEAMDSAAESQKREKWTMTQLRRCGRAVGEEDPRKIAVAVETALRRSAA